MNEQLIQSEQYQALLAEFRKFLLVKGYTTTTQHNIAHAIVEMMLYMQERSISDIKRIDPDKIQEYYHYLNERPNYRRKGSKGLSSSMLNHQVFSMRVFFNWCAKVNAIDLHPFTGLSFPKAYSPKRKALTKQQVNNLYRACISQRERAILGLFYGCGLRRSEGVSIDLKDIDYTLGKLTVRSGKFERRREVPIHSKILEDFRAYQFGERRELIKNHVPAFNENSEHPFLLNNAGNRMKGRNANTMVKKIAQRALFSLRERESMSLHSLRHSIATHFKENGMPLEQIKQFLGHSSLDMTQAYLEGYSLNWNQVNNRTKLDADQLVVESIVRADSKRIHFNQLNQK
ncbi:MAG: tyrosine-type recombinase/integrase [Bacteroidia bacterium]|nr:tyrosine-type recombinase/integrase [Bacteroidia bacterium]